MATGFKSNGADLDTIFKARYTTKGSDVDYHDGGVDISNALEKWHSGADLAPATGFKDSGTDLNSRFLDIDWPVIGADWPFSDTYIYDNPAGSTGSAYFYFGVNGTFAAYQNGSSSGQIYDWLDVVSTDNGKEFSIKYALNSGDAPTYLGMEGGGSFGTSYGTVTGNFYIGFSGQTAKECNVSIYIAENATGAYQKVWTGTLKVEPQS